MPLFRLQYVEGGAQGGAARLCKKYRQITDLQNTVAGRARGPLPQA
jgi:hypothetical protein